MSDRKEPFLMRLRGQDKVWLEMLSTIHGVSKSAIMRIALVNYAKEQGLVRMSPDEYLKNK